MPRYIVELERADERWIGEVRDHPGLIAYGASPIDAFRRVIALLPSSEGAEYYVTEVPSCEGEGGPET